jgi:DNA-binding MarR family transcriptional regulator
VNEHLVLFELVERLSNLLRQEQRKVASQHGLKLVQLEALQHLARANRYSDTPLAMAEALGLTKGTVSQTLSALEAKGFMRKTTDDADARVTHCRLTRNGRDIVRESLPPALMSDAASELGGKNLQDLTLLLEDLLRHAQRRSGGRVFGICNTCKHFEAGANEGGTCGLTREKLLPADTLLRCREHEL